ncbi:MAG: hypothetical protein EWM72_01388 [Nitrospira sp.]|nr:MAG: hypothetical protein EWM72_01388 [Nitrospira sp.]
MMAYGVWPIVCRKSKQNSHNSCHEPYAISSVFQGDTFHDSRLTSSKSDVIYLPRLLALLSPLVASCALLERVMASLLEYVGCVHIYLGPYRGNPISLYLKRTESGCQIGPKAYPWNDVMGVGETPNKAAADFEEKWKTKGLTADMYSGPAWEGGIKPEKPAPPKPAASAKPAAPAANSPAPTAQAAPPSVGTPALAASAPTADTQPTAVPASASQPSGKSN